MSGDSPPALSMRLGPGSEPLTLRRFRCLASQGDDRQERSLGGRTWLMPEKRGGRLPGRIQRRCGGALCHIGRRNTNGLKACPRLHRAEYLWWTRTAMTWSTTLFCLRPMGTKFSGRAATRGDFSSSSIVILPGSPREGPHSRAAASSNGRERWQSLLPRSYWPVRRICAVILKPCSWGSRLPRKAGGSCPFTSTHGELTSNLERSKQKLTTHNERG